MASPVGSDSAQVQVMTIHRAKGLEFDIVILPDLQRGPRTADRPLLYWTTVATGPDERGIVLASRADANESDGSADALERWMRRLGRERESLELGRIAYVASTRARRRLHLIGTAGLRETSEGSVLRPRVPQASWDSCGPSCPRTLNRRSPCGSRGPRAATGLAQEGHVSRRRRRDASSPVSARRHRNRRRRPTCFASRAKRTGSIRPEFDWAGEIAKAVGQIVHDEFQRIRRRCGHAEAGRSGTASLGAETPRARHRRCSPAGCARADRARHENCLGKRSCRAVPRSGSA